MRNFKEYLKLICEGDITSVRAKMQAKQRGLVHQSHDIWKDKSGAEFRWNEQGKRFKKVDKKTAGEVIFSQDVDLRTMKKDSSKRLSKEEIKKILSDHDFWLKDQDESGKSANLEGADISKADLSNTDLRRANFHGANLKGVNFFNTNLSYTDLSNTDLSNANLAYADLLGANLEGADISGMGLSKNQIKSVKNDKTTKVRYNGKLVLLKDIK